MVSAGNYLYGFTDGRFQPGTGLRGLRNMPLRVLACGEVGAVVSRHPVQPLMPLRANLEPHHRVVRQIASETTLVPAAFGHISESDQQMVAVIRENHDEIRQELERLAGKCEMGVKLSWAVPNIFDHLVRQDRELRELRDRVFVGREPSMPEKLQVGELFAAKLGRERDRVAAVLSRRFAPIAAEVRQQSPREDKVAADLALLVERAGAGEFARALQGAATEFDASFALEASGPWPPYSFVRLRLQRATPTAAA
jgi:hypothetical protein